MSTSVRRSLPLAVALCLVALLLPFSGPVQANHGSRTLDVEPETQSKDPDAEGDAGTATFVATISAAPTFETGSIQIDFELEAGPNDKNGDSPNQPDLTCTIIVDQTSCSVSYNGDTAGVDRWRAWIDHDGQNNTTEADPNEGRNEMQQPGTPSTSLTQCRANQTEPDCTDVVQVTWTGLKHPGSVDCDDSGGPDTERETNRSGGGSASNESYTCEVFDEEGNPLVDQDPDTAGNQPTTVYAENEGGPNDKDDGTSYDTPDYTCETDPGDDVFEGSHECDDAITVTQAEGQEGTATICFWVVGEDDAGDVGAAGHRHCQIEGEEVGENQKADGSDTPNDRADRTELTWEDPRAAGLDVETETATLTVGAERELTATVYDQFGAEFGGNTQVLFEFFQNSPADRTNAGGDGNSTGSPDEECTTQASSTCTLTYSTTAGGRDLICAWVGDAPALEGSSRNASGTCNGEKRVDEDDDEEGADAPEPRDDRIDVVETTWQNDPPATRLNCSPEQADGVTVQRHRITCTATTEEPDSKVANTEVDVEMTGAGDGDGNTPAKVDKTCTTNDDGKCTFSHVSNKAGTTEYRAWIDADYEDSTTEADADEGRDEDETPGAEEPDNTDVVEHDWEKGDREVRFWAKAKSVERGDSVKLHGRIRADAGGVCENGQTVRLKVKRLGTGDNNWSFRRTAKTNGKGYYSFGQFRMWNDMRFKAITPKNGGCEWDASRGRVVRTT